MNPKNIKDELRDLNSDLPSSGTPYSVPDGYFEGLPNAILKRIKEQGSDSAKEEIALLSPLLAGISRQMPNYIPDHFFDTSLNEVPVLIAEDIQSPLLNQIGKSMPFSIPANYFQNLPLQIVNKVYGRKAKVIPIRKHNWSRLLVAASVTAIIAFSGIFYFNNKNNTPKDPIAQVKKLSTSDISDFLKSTDAGLNSNNITAKNPSRINDVKNMLQDVPDNELDNFLKQVPSEEDDLAVN